MTATLRGPRSDDAPAGPARGRRRPLLVGAVAAVAVIALVWVLAFSPVLGAGKVTVRGNHAVSAAQVRAAADIAHGTPLLRLDTGAVARRIEALPDVADARVTVSYPSTLIITVDERVAVGYLVQGTGAVLIDKTGRQFRTVATVPSGLPRFDVLAGADAQAAGHAIAVVAAALPRTVLSLLSSIQGSGTSAITLILRDQRSVRWGSFDRSADKARVLPTLLARAGTFIDVSNPDEVYSR